MTTTWEGIGTPFLAGEVGRSGRRKKKKKKTRLVSPASSVVAGEAQEREVPLYPGHD